MQVTPIVPQSIIVLYLSFNPVKEKEQYENYETFFKYQAQDIEKYKENKTYKSK